MASVDGNFAGIDIPEPNRKEILSFVVIMSILVAVGNENIVFEISLWHGGYLPCMTMMPQI